MKNIYLIFSFLITKALFAQVGVGTTNPQQVLHIDAARNNNTSIQNNHEDDVVVTAEGKLGIGTINPLTRVDLRSNTDTDNVIAIGSTTQTASQAKEGALQYNNNLKL